MPKPGSEPGNVRGENMDEAVLKSKITKLIFPVALLFPMALMTVNPVYDELWSLSNFAPLPLKQILTDLSLPNNHPLNSFFLKVLSVFSLNTVFLRLPSLISAAFIPVLCGQLAYRWSRSNHLGAMVAAAVLAMLSVPLAVFGGLARGYAMQLFFWLLCIWAMSTVRDDPKRAAILTAIGGIGTILSVPTGVLLLLPAGIGFLIFSGKKERCDHRMWIAAGVIALFGGIFYITNYSALRAGQVWGMNIDNAGDFFRFLGITLTSLIVVPSLFAVFPALYNFPQRFLGVALLCLPLLLAPLSNGGPARTYLYLPVAVAVAGGIGLGELTARCKERQWLFSGCVAVLLAVPGIFLQTGEWRVLDYTEIFEKHRQSLPAEILPVYRASSGYPITNALPEALEEYNSQLLSAGFRKIAFFEAGQGQFNGLDENFSEAVIDTSCHGSEAEYDGLKCVVYDLARSDSVEAGKNYLLIFNPHNPLPENIPSAGKMLYLNIWFTRGVKMAVLHCEKTLPLPGGIKVYRIGE